MSNLGKILPNPAEWESPLRNLLFYGVQRLAREHSAWEINGNLLLTILRSHKSRDNSSLFADSGWIFYFLKVIDRPLFQRGESCSMPPLIRVSS